MSEPVDTLEGWYVLHDFRRLNWPAWQGLGSEARATAEAAWRQWWQQEGPQRSAEAGSSAAFAIVGHKADVMFLHFRRRLDDLYEVEHGLDRVGRQLWEQVWSYLSVVELSGYLARGGADHPEVQRRLFPAMPHHRYVCFYPMNKRRQGNDNWYRLSREERAQLMRGHGEVGRRYAGQVLQIITGSQGLDDWEWGVTLFADDPLVFKKLVYEMRFDETSARYADFGPFWVGMRLDDEWWQPWSLR
ncbi:MAG: heme-dependent peroxidase [Firmicutes bacterium]|nr:heme-dependent peroxidase [Alicyclobacillaceae bacterium]MCL6498228.1 heme-dependent peroxidase [Bacillota bacterium]